VNQARPALKRNAIEGQFGPSSLIKLVKNDLDDNHVRIETIDSRRIHQIRSNSARVLVPPLPVIGNEPPKVFEQMRSRNIGDFVPQDTIR
jgi:hypothetical protein